MTYIKESKSKSWTHNRDKSWMQHFTFVHARLKPMNYIFKPKPKSNSKPKGFLESSIHYILVSTDFMSSPEYREKNIKNMNNWNTNRIIWASTLLNILDYCSITLLPPQKKKGVALLANFFFFLPLHFYLGAHSWGLLRHCRSNRCGCSSTPNIRLGSWQNSHKIQYSLLYCSLWLLLKINLYVIEHLHLHLNNTIWFPDISLFPLLT